MALIMEILIQIPPWLVQILELAHSKGQVFYGLVTRHFDSIWTFITYQWNSLFLMLSMVFFWPMWVYIAVTLTTASTWIFWIFASLTLGLIQMIYVCYQFVMIGMDVMILTCLKTYQVSMRSRTTQFLFFFSKTLRKKRINTSRRRKWRRECEAAKSYSEFLKVQVLEPKERDSEKTTQVKPPMKRRTRSFATMKTLHEEHGETTNQGPESPRRPAHEMKRMSSLSEALLDFDKSNTSPDKNPTVAQDLGEMTAELLQSTLVRLKEARKSCTSENDLSSLEHLLAGVVKRNHLTLEDLLVNNSRAVAYSGQYKFSSASRRQIDAYYNEVSTGLDLLADAPVSVDKPLPELYDRITLIRKMKQNMGRTALMLSGGGAQAMYHLGTLRALIDARLYDDIKVISGTSGGSIAAACCAMYSTKELLERICVPIVSTDFKLNGEMKKKNIRWFPPIQDMVTYWLKKRLLVDSKYFYRTCEFYFGTTTFAEAFERTGKHVCITVSASRASGGTAQRLLLNHISTPHVTLASAVAASCALPGVMKPAKLQTKNSLGEIEPFEVDGVEWIDGSVQADLPFQRISTLFNVPNYIVCQTNFHVQPFLNKDHHPSTRSAYWKLFQLFEWDIRSRALRLGKLGLFPKIFGQDISKVFKQKYHGNLTLVPRFTAAQTFGLKALVNPSLKEMEGYLKYGQVAAWPYISVIRDMIRLEKSLDDCLERLKTRCSKLHVETDISDADDLDSIASSGPSVGVVGLQRNGVRFAGQHLEVERLKKKVSKLEDENQDLKKKLQEAESFLRSKVGKKHEAEEKNEVDGKQEIEEENSKKISEGRVWDIFRDLDRGSGLSNES